MVAGGEIFQGRMEPSSDLMSDTSRMLKVKVQKVQNICTPLELLLEGGFEVLSPLHCCRELEFAKHRPPQFLIRYSNQLGMLFEVAWTICQRCS